MLKNIKIFELCFISCRCSCEPGFDSDLCKQTKISFRGDGLAWFQPLSACENSKLSIEIMTDQESGLILYNGPMYDTSPDVNDDRDFLAVELVSGHARVQLNIGDSEDQPLTLAVDGQSARRLDDGEWHTIELFKNNRVSTEHTILVAAAAVVVVVVVVAVVVVVMHVL